MMSHFNFEKLHKKKKKGGLYLLKTKQHNNQKKKKRRLYANIVFEDISWLINT